LNRQGRQGRQGRQEEQYTNNNMVYGEEISRGYPDPGNVMGLDISYVFVFLGALGGLGGKYCC